MSVPLSEMGDLPPREVLLGYDARATFRPAAAVWPPERRAQYLYRTDANRPLSVDVQVWPTIFQAAKRPPIQTRVGPQGCWSAFADLQAALTTLFRKQPLPKFAAIAITLVDATREIDLSWTSPFPAAAPPARNPQWRFLGYDVADRYFLSALTNCGFLADLDDVEAMRARWAPLLNEHHLFGELMVADQFRRVSDRRLEGDHAPTYVFGLWLLE